MYQTNTVHKIPVMQIFQKLIICLNYESITKSIYNK